MPCKRCQLYFKMLLKLMNGAFFLLDQWTRIASAERATTSSSRTAFKNPGWKGRIPCQALTCVCTAHPASRSVVAPCVMSSIAEAHPNILEDLGCHLATRLTSNASRSNRPMHPNPAELALPIPKTTHTDCQVFRIELSAGHTSRAREKV